MSKNPRTTFVLEELAFSQKEYALPTMRNTLREFLKLSRPLHSVSVVAKQAPLALSNAKVSCKHGLWLVARVNKKDPESNATQDLFTIVNDNIYVY